LISNAIKFSNANDVISINAKTEGRFIEFTIEDQGIGIQPDILPQLFEIRKENISQGTQGESGTGLGLSLCKEFVEKMNGTIWAESEVGKGSCFHFTIPVSEQGNHI
jgi:two-component system, sensor histidine kinase and response regulator